MSPLFGGLANKGNTDDIMKELKERREQKLMEKQEENANNTNNTNEKLEEGDQEKINKFGNILIQGTLKKRNFFKF